MEGPRKVTFGQRKQKKVSFHRRLLKKASRKFPIYVRGSDLFFDTQRVIKFILFKKSLTPILIWKQPLMVICSSKELNVKERQSPDYMNPLRLSFLQSFHSILGSLSWKGLKTNLQIFHLLLNFFSQNLCFSFAATIILKPPIPSADLIHRLHPQ